MAHPRALTWQQILDDLATALAPLRFTAPITHVYNPLDYARAPYYHYLRKYGQGSKEVLLVGMNPGPWGMAQTGIPFGEVTAVTEWLRVRGAIGVPTRMHPKRPVQGFQCPRSEVSGRRLWGWAKTGFHTPEKFFAKFLVMNYCPLMFMEAGGKNRTPDKLPKAEQHRLFAACDQALRHAVRKVQPKYVFGIGRFATERARLALDGFTNLTIHALTPPSPANPKANRGWAALIERELSSAGLRW